MDECTSHFTEDVDERVASLLLDLIAFPTVNPPGDEEAIAGYLARWFASRGIDCEMTEVAPRRPNIVARVKFRRPGPTFVFNSHMDVVPAGAGWNTDPFKPEIRNGFVYGRGSADAKGPLAGMMVATSLLKEGGEHLRGEIIFQGVVDEEVGSAGTRALIGDLKADMAIVGEPTGGQICVAHKGTARALIVVPGRTAHAAEPALGLNAITGAGLLLEELNRYHEELKSRTHPVCGSPTATVTIIAGGVKSNMVPDRCELQLSRRMLPGEDEALVARELEELLARFSSRHPAFRPYVERFFQTSGGPSETPSDHPFVVLAKEAAIAVTGKDLGFGGLSVNCDMSLLRGVAGVPTIILGPGQTAMAHQPNECVSIAELGTVTRAYASIAARALMQYEQKGE